MIIILAKSRYFDGPGLVVTDESGKEAVPGFIPPHPDTGTVVNRLFLENIFIKLIFKLWNIILLNK